MQNAFRHFAHNFSASRTALALAWMSIRSLLDKAHLPWLLPVGGNANMDEPNLRISVASHLVIADKLVNLADLALQKSQKQTVRTFSSPGRADVCGKAVQMGRRLYPANLGINFLGAIATVDRNGGAELRADAVQEFRHGADVVQLIPGGRVIKACGSPGQLPEGKVSRVLLHFLFHVLAKMDAAKNRPKTAIITDSSGMVSSQTFA